MTRAQPPGAPPENWVPRSDGSTRAVVGRLDKMEEGLSGLGNTVARMEGEVKQAITPLKLLAILGAIGIVIVGIVGAIIGLAWFRFADDSRQLRAEVVVRLDRQDARQDAEKARAEAADAKRDAKLDALLRVNVEGQPRGVAAEELEKRTGEKRDHDFWKRNRTR